MLLPVLFFLAACSSPCSRWQITAIDADCPPHTYYKVSSKPGCLFNGLEAELVCHGDERHFYLNACTLLLPSDPDNCGYTNVNLTLGDESYNFSAVLFQGNQRVELPPAAVELVLDALLNDICVEITIGHYQETLIADNFSILYSQL